MDWENDPELKQLRAEFVDSLKERHQGLKSLLQKINTQGMNTESRTTAVFIAHKLAGAAQTYGFPALTRIAEKIDDLLTASEADRPFKLSPQDTVLYLELLRDSLDQAIQTGLDPVSCLGDSRMKKLTSAAESLLDSTKS